MDRRRKPLYQEQVELGRNVERLRRDRKWSRAALARRAKVTPATILALEAAIKSTQLAKLKQIAKALDTTVDALKMTGPDDRRTKDLNDEDYEIAQWFHHAPRVMKNRVWLLREDTGGAALTDPLFVPLLEAWPTLTPRERNYILESYHFIKQHQVSPMNREIGGGGLDGVSTVPKKVRPPER